jgi:integrase/recombinase XerC
MQNLVPAHPSAGALVASWLESLVPATRKAYLESLRDYASWKSKREGPPVEHEPVGYYASAFLAGGPGAANLAALEFQTALKARSLAPATVNLKIQALRALCKMGRMMGIITWGLDVRQLRSEPYRDTRGPGLTGVQALFATAQRGKPFVCLRDTALLSMLFSMGLRSHEVLRLNMPDLDLAKNRLAVTGKGFLEPKWLTIPPGAKGDLLAWLAARGELLAGLGIPAADPVFFSFHHGHRTERLGKTGLWYLMRTLGARTGGLGAVRPHGIRHTAATTVLELTGGDLAAAQRFGRWADPKPVMIYNDNREDVAGELAGKLDALIHRGDG